MHIFPGYGLFSSYQDFIVACYGVYSHINVYHCLFSYVLKNVDWVVLKCTSMKLIIQSLFKQLCSVMQLLIMRMNFENVSNKVVNNSLTE